ncbi:MAG: hypothetical protein IJO70_00700 [Lachnospiraceae bacterium]|nr:hypothetical protein [Lachnospiraceae bacterium]
MKKMKNLTRTRRVVIVILGLLLILLPFVFTKNLVQKKYNPYGSHMVLTGYVCEYSCSFNGGNSITPSEYYDIKEVLAERMEYVPIEKINLFCSKDASRATLSVGYEGDMFISEKIMFDILTCKGELFLATMDESNNDEVIIWLTNEDLASAKDNSKYDPSEGNSYGVLFRVEEDSIQRYREMMEYSVEKNTEIFVFLDGEIIDSFIYVDSDKVPSKNVGEGKILVRTESIEENTKLMMVGTAPVLKTEIELVE